MNQSGTNNEMFIFDKIAIIITTMNMQYICAHFPPSV